MTQQQKARRLTIAVIAVVIGLLTLQKSGWRLPYFARRLVSAEPPRAPEPRDAIYKMLDAARAGDAAAYLACFTGQMEAMLEQSRAEMGEPAFARYLTDTNREIKGIALSEPVAITDREVQVRVEYVYQDRNEAQPMFLEKAANGEWRISRLDAALRVKTLVPYGTPVN